MLAVALGLLAALGFACAGIFARMGLQSLKTSTATAVSVITSFTVIGLLTVAYNVSAIGDLAPIAFVWCFAAGMVSFPTARLLNYLSVSMIGATRTAAMISAQPLFAAALAMAFLGERPNWLIGLGTVVVVAAMAIIALERQRGQSEHARFDRRFLLGCGIGVLAGAGYGGASVLTKMIVEDHATPLTGVTFSLLFGGIAMVALAGRDMGSAMRVPRRHLAMMAISGVSSGGAVTSLFFAFNRAEVIVVSPIVAIFPLITLIISHLFLKRLERITWRLVAGTLVVVAGVIMVVIGQN